MASRWLFQSKTNLHANRLYFSITPKTLPNKDIIATIKDVKDLENKESDTIHAKICLTLQNSKPF